jgi:hypothetical protein
MDKRCAQTGDVFVMAVVGSNSGDNAWGTETYSDDSWVGTAAVHAGFGAVGATITVKVTCAGPQTSFTGSTANGVTTKSFGAWASSYTFELAGVQAPPKDDTGVCVGPCLYQRCANPGDVMQVKIRGTLFGYVYGTGTYSDDSWPGTAAVHAGAIAVGQVATLTVTCSGSASSLTGSTQYGVTSKSWGAWPTTFTIGPAGSPPPAVECTHACLYNKCLTDGQLQVVTVTGTTYGNVWGSGPFTDDSYVSTAAVFAGKVALGETATLQVRCTGDFQSFPGGSAHGVTTLSYGAWGFSYMFV